MVALVFVLVFFFYKSTIASNTSRQLQLWAHSSVLFVLRCVRTSIFYQFCGRKRSQTPFAVTFPSCELPPCSKGAPLSLRLVRVDWPYPIRGSFTQLTFDFYVPRIYVWENSEIMTLNTVACVRLELLCEDWGAIERTGQSMTPPSPLLNSDALKHNSQRRVMKKKRKKIRYSNGSLSF